MPPLNDKKLEKIQKLLEIANEDFATPEDVIKMSEALISVVVSEKNKLESQLNDTNSKLSTEVNKTLAQLTEKENGLRAIISRLSAETDKALTNTQNALSKEIKRVERKIPTKTDLTGLESRIEAIQEALTTVPTEITANPEAVRDALELLSDDDRLDKSAIRGLDELIEDLRTIARTSQPQAVGVRLLRYLSDVNIEGITDGQTLVWDVATQRFIPGSGGTGGGHTIEDEGTPLTQRTNLNFVGAAVTVTDDAGNDATVVTISGGGSGTVNTIVAGNNIDVDATDPANPIVSVETLTLADISDVTASITEINYIDGVTSAIQAQLNNKEPLKGADDNYVTDAEKAALHAAVTVTDSTSIDLTITGQDITAQREALTGAITAPKNSNTTSLGSFTVAQLNTAISDADVATGGGTATGTNTGDQTSIVGITGTKAQFDTAVTDGNILYVGDVTQYTDELAQDAVGAMVATSIVYNDAGATLQRAALTGAITASQDSNTTSLGSFTKAQLDTAVSDGNVLFVGDVTTNATHTGEVTGSGALTVDKTAITNKTLVTAAVGDQILVADASDTDNLKRVTVQTIVDLAGGGATTLAVAQTAHGLSAGNLIRSNGTADQYAVADKDAGSTADAVGYVTAVADANNFTYQPFGFIVTNNIPVATAGSALFVGDSGAFTTTEPVSVGEISKPVGIVLSSATRAVVFNMRGMEVTAVTSPPPSATIGLVTALANGFTSL